MSQSSYTKFNFVDQYGKYGIVSQLEDNLKSFLDWAFLNIGAYTNISKNQSNLYGTSMCKLQQATDPALAGKAWESFKKDWVWESGVTYNSGSPINISGVYINDNFIPGPTGNSTYPYHINYPLGRVTFNKALTANTKVEAEYSFRNIQVYKSNESDWFKELQENSYDPSKYSNIKTITANHRVQMPCIILELLPRTVLSPYELGSRRNIILQDLMFHVLAENYSDRMIIIDILLNQKDKTLLLYDINKVVSDNAYSLDYRGSKNPNGKGYEEILSDSDYTLNTAHIKNMDMMDLETYGPNIFKGSLRASFLIFP
jgi:hypothetical protein